MLDEVAFEREMVFLCCDSVATRRNHTSPTTGRKRASEHLSCDPLQPPQKCLSLIKKPFPVLKVLQSPISLSYPYIRYSKFVLCDTMNVFIKRAQLPLYQSLRGCCRMWKRMKRRPNARSMSFRNASCTFEYICSLRCPVARVADIVFVKIGQLGYILIRLSNRMAASALCH